MKILTLKLDNFRGIKKLEINFGPKTTSIYGANGTGKTTVANAISYLITGQAITGEKDFSPKTSGTHNLHHTVSGSFELDTGEIINFSKDFHEVWKKKKGSEEKTFSGNTVDYFINSVPTKEKDYIKAMEKICGGDLNIAKLLMISGYFTETLSLEARRNILFEICGEVTDTEIIKNNNLEALNEYLKIPGTTNVYSIDEYKKIAINGRKEINRKLEIIPERIDELMHSIPELPDKEEINLELNNLKIKINELQTKRSLLTDDNGFKVSLDKQVAVIKNRIEEYRAAYHQKNNNSNEETYKKINELSKQHSDLYLLKSQLDVDINSHKMQIKQLTDERNNLIDEYMRVAQKNGRKNGMNKVQYALLAGRLYPRKELRKSKKNFLKDVMPLTRKFLCVRNKLIKMDNIVPLKLLNNWKKNLKH